MSFKNESLDVSFSKIKEIGFVKIGEFMYNGVESEKCLNGHKGPHQWRNIAFSIMFHMQARAPTFDMKDSREYPAIESQL